MTEEEKKAAAEQKQREMEEMMRQAQESYRQEYASMPYDGPVYGLSLIHISEPTRH